MYWITQINKSQIGFGPCPSEEQLEQELLSYQTEGIKLVVSLLEEMEIDSCGCTNEDKICIAKNIEYLIFPIRDMSIPSLKSLINFIELLYAKTYLADKIYIHCRHGIGRSSLVVASLLVRSGMELKGALLLMEQKRGLKVPETLSQKKLLSAYSNSIK